MASVFLAACSPSVEAREEECEKTYESLILSVENVENVHFGCNREYHYYTEGGLIEVGDVTRDEALEMLDAILKKFARSPDLDDVERPGVLLKSSNGSVEVRPGDLGFSEDPNIRELRTRYGER